MNLSGESGQRHPLGFTSTSRHTQTSALESNKADALMTRAVAEKVVPASLVVFTFCFLAAAGSGSGLEERGFETSSSLVANDG